ncbi:DNA-binding protein RFX8 [Morphnus guianensis]
MEKCSYYYLWIADNFYLCEGCTVPRWLLYELYMESCSPNSKYQVNSATFGKLIRLVFPGLGTRRLGTRGSTRYHYDGIAIKKNSSFHARYCSLLSEKNYHSSSSPPIASSKLCKRYGETPCDFAVTHFPLLPPTSSSTCPVFTQAPLSRGIEQLRLAAEHLRGHRKESIALPNVPNMNVVPYLGQPVWLFRWTTAFMAASSGRGKVETSAVLEMHLVTRSIAKKKEHLLSWDGWILGLLEVSPQGMSKKLVWTKTEQERFQYPWPEFNRFYLLEQELGKKYPYEMVVLLANEYYSHCQDILHMVRKSELDKVEDCIMSFWRSLQPERIALMSLPDVCQLFKSYDRQLFKEMENILLHDFLEEMPVQHMKSIRLFSKNVELWLLNALGEFPLPLQTSKSEEVTVFVRRLRRKTDLSNMAKTMRTVLTSNSKVTVLRSDLHAVIDQGFLDVPGNLFQMEFRSPEELQSDIELKCLNDLMSLLAPSTDIRVLLNCVSSNLQAFIIQPSRSKEEFRKLASDFQLRWNFLLSAVSKAMTLNYADSFGSWHLFNLLLMDFVAHIFLSYIEEDGDESFWVAKQNESPVLWVYDPSHVWGYFAEEQPQATAPQTALVTLMQSQSNFGLSNVFPEF